MERKGYQQGDLLLVVCEEIPVDAVSIKQRGVRGHVLAEGEATGHAHRVDAGDLFVAKDGKHYLRLELPATVTHEEHDPVALEPGIYEVDRVREVDPFSEEIRYIAD